MRTRTRPWLALAGLGLALLALSSCAQRSRSGLAGHPAPGPGDGAPATEAVPSGRGAGESAAAGPGTGPQAPGAVGTEVAAAPAAGADGAGGTVLAALPPPHEFVETPALRDIRFDFDDYEIRPADRAVLDENARWLQQHPETLVLLEGHADERGTNEYNLALGERRARAARDYLVSAGIDQRRITLISYGEERPVCTERTEACWAQNRRVHFLVRR